MFARERGDAGGRAAPRRYFFATTIVLIVAVHAVDDLDDDHVGADVLDRLRQVHVAFVDLQPARFADRVGDVLRGDRAEQAAVGAGLLGDRQHRAVEQVDVLLGFLDRLARRALGGLLALADRLDRALGGRLGELARDQVVAQVALRDVDDVALLAERLDVLEEDRLRHRRAAYAVAVAAIARAGCRRARPR